MTIALNDYERVARSLDVDPNFIRAVGLVESNGRGFNADGTIVLRFERHVFIRELRKAKYLEHDIELARNLAGVRADTVALASGISPTCTMLATSYGMFQIMGFNHKVAGHDKVEEFVAAQNLSETNQLETFATFARNAGLLVPMRNKDYARFARLYNGPSYANNKYDIKLKAEYERLSK